MSSKASSADNPYIDVQGRTDAHLYLMGILDGSVIAGEKMKKLAEKMLTRIDEGYKDWHYDADAATRPVEFIERFCYMPSGKLGVPFILEPYERTIVELTFGFVDEEFLRQFQYVLIEMARKCGKTSLGAAIELYMLMADGEGAPQVYNAATSKGQASLAFGAAWRMVRQSPKLRKRLRKGTVVERAESGIINDDNFGYAIPLSKQSDHLDGLDVSFALLDEMAAMEDRATFDLVKQGTGARSQPLMMAITTQGFVRGGLWDAERNYAVRWLNDDIEDDRFLAMLYELDDRSEIWDERMWVKANPGIDTVKKREYLRAQVVKAKNDSNYMPTLLTKDFNLPANQATAFLTFEEACNSATYEFDPEVFRYCIVGIDAADTLDLNCATALFMRPGDPHIYRKSMYWIAEEQVKVNSNSQRQRDGVPYDIWAANGYIRIVPGNVVSHRCFLDWVQELADMGMYTRAIGFDRWGMREIVQDMKMMVGEQNVVPIPFGAQSLSGPMKELKAMMRDGLIVDGDNPIDHWCNLNVTAKVDINDNVQPIKKGGPTTRIDGFAALLCAYKVLRERWDDYQILIGEDLED